MDLNKKMESTVVLIAGPSCAGKNTIVEYLLSSGEIKFRETVSFTTRQIRDGETDGVDYYFKTHEEAQDLIRSGKVLEYNFYDDKYYGTLASEMESRGEDVILMVIDVNGVKNIKKKMPHAKAIFIMPPGNSHEERLNELKRRFLARGGNTMESIEKRLKTAEEEMKEADFFDKIIVNDVLEKAQKETLEYVKEILEKNG